MEEPQQLIRNIFVGSHRHMAHFPGFASSRHLATARVCVGGSSGELRQGGPQARRQGPSEGQQAGSRHYLGAKHLWGDDLGDWWGHLPGRGSVWVCPSVWAEARRPSFVGCRSRAREKENVPECGMPAAQPSTHHAQAEDSGLQAYGAWASPESVRKGACH